MTVGHRDSEAANAHEFNAFVGQWTDSPVGIFTDRVCQNLHPCRGERASPSVVSQFEILHPASLQAICARKAIYARNMKSSDFFFQLTLTVCIIGLVILGGIAALNDGVVHPASVFVGVGTLGLMVAFFLIGIICAICGYRP
jgi:small-conductance mechanosensitive channel